MGELTLIQMVEMIQQMGGYGVAVLALWFWRRADDERLRYRDLHETILGAIPQMTRAIKEISQDIKEIKGK